MCSYSKVVSSCSPARNEMEQNISAAPDSWRRCRWSRLYVKSCHQTPLEVVDLFLAPTCLIGDTQGNKPSSWKLRRLSGVWG